jgi:hypothetical protein
MTRLQLLHRLNDARCARLAAIRWTARGNAHQRSICLSIAYRAILDIRAARP